MRAVGPMNRPACADARCDAAAGLKWKDILKVMDYFGMEAPDEADPLVAKVKAINARAWEQHAELRKQRIPNKALVALLTANGVPETVTKRLKTHEVMWWLCDAMGNG